MAAYLVLSAALFIPPALHFRASLHSTSLRFIQATFLSAPYSPPTAQIDRESDKDTKAIRANKEVTIKARAPIIGISETAIENNIQKLKSSNVLDRIGSGKEGRWIYTSQSYNRY